MKINKNQALYRALPSCWTTYSDSDKSDYKYACKVIAWNTKTVCGINEDMIKNDIARRVASFQIAGGIVMNEFDANCIDNFEFVEPSIIEKIPDIVCEINPKIFYCQKCNSVINKRNATEAPSCPSCREKGKNSKTNQLQMIYACKCGFADGIKTNGNEPLFYHWREKENQFKFFTVTGKKREMTMNCPLCNKTILPKNATDSRLFYAASGSIVNLFNEKYSGILKKYKFDAEILMLAKWFDVINNEKFLNILESPKDFFEFKSKDINDPEVIRFANSLCKTPQEIVDILNAPRPDIMTIGKIKKEIDNILPLSILGDKTKLITLNLLEFDTLKYPKSSISLKKAISKGKELGFVLDENDVYDLLEKMKIDFIQVSEAVQIVKYAYGFTRLRNCPDGSADTADLRLRGFDKNKVYTSILDTEGILFELNMLKIFSWLQDNGIVPNDIELNTKEEAKKWFVETLNLDSISHFTAISAERCNLVTKVVYSLIHTISHMMIISAGKHSGLSKDSFSEIIFPDSCSFFIYPTSSEGITLGSISGMFETYLEMFLQDALKDNEICTFDPICSTHQNGACVACTYLSEVNCVHFNKDLSRSYLYGGTIKLNNEKINIKKGFWK